VSKPLILIALLFDHVDSVFGTRDVHDEREPFSGANGAGLGWAIVHGMNDVAVVTRPKRLMLRSVHGRATVVGWLSVEMTDVHPIADTA
jgi:hypothetical protein